MEVMRIAMLLILNTTVVNMGGHKQIQASVVQWEALGYFGLPAIQYYMQCTQCVSPLSDMLKQGCIRTLFLALIPPKSQFIPLASNALYHTISHAETSLCWKKGKEI
ncbi:hypothetical protein SLEP1_g17372 [Rubroshorea leprosula]|nr:hypothetical protein SLEP1_g17372 [Rubroshorea leprosula]